MSNNDIKNLARQRREAEVGFFVPQPSNLKHEPTIKVIGDQGARHAVRVSLLLVSLSLLALIIFGIVGFSEPSRSKGFLLSANAHIGDEQQSNQLMTVGKRQVAGTSKALLNRKYYIGTDQSDFSDYPMDRGFSGEHFGSNHRGVARLLMTQGPGQCWVGIHPGPFRYWNGQQNGCFVQVWRQFQDGCTHYEWFNTCAGLWDPQIYWTYCVH